MSGSGLNDERIIYGKHDGYDDGHDFAVLKPFEKPAQVPYRPIESAPLQMEAPDTGARVKVVCEW